MNNLSSLALGSTSTLIRFFVPLPFPRWTYRFASVLVSSSAMHALRLGSLPAFSPCYFLFLVYSHNTLWGFLFPSQRFRFFFSPAIAASSATRGSLARGVSTTDANQSVPSTSTCVLLQKYTEWYVHTCAICIYIQIYLRWAGFEKKTL